MIILGVDPGFGITGYGLIKVGSPGSAAPELVEAGALTSDRKKPLCGRLQEIYQHLCEILEEFSPQAMAVEEIYSDHAFPRSGIHIGKVQGVILLAAAEKKIPIQSYFPIQVKKALLGHGRATKPQVQKMVQRALNLQEVPRPDDVADALAVALCHANRIRSRGSA